MRYSDLKSVQSSRFVAEQLKFDYSHSDIPMKHKVGTYLMYKNWF